MKFALAAFESAVSEHVSAEIAGRLRLALRVLRGEVSEQVDEREAGAILASALCPREGAWNAGALPLLSVELESELAGGLTLEALDALEHPLLRGWVAGSLGGALAAPILAGLALTNLAPGAPVFDAVGVVALEGRGLSGRADLSWPGVARVTAFYGETPGSLACATYRCTTGDLLVQLGIAARLHDPASMLDPKAQGRTEGPVVFH